MANYLQSNFSYGEVAPDLQGFVNDQAFARGVLIAENMLNMVNGGLGSRTGTYFAGTTAANAAGILIPFVFNSGESLTLEFTPGRIRFYENNGQLQIAYNLSAATWATGTVTLTVTAASHCFLVGDTITVAGMTPSAYNGTYTVTGVGTQTIQYALVSNPGAESVLGTVQGAYQLTSTPWSTTALLPTSWAQSQDVLYIASAAGSVPIYQLSRLSAVNWTLAQWKPSMGPFQAFNISATTMTASGGGLTITASANTFASTDVGRLIAVIDTSQSYNGSVGAWIWCTIATYVSATQVTTTQWYKTVGGVDTAVTWAGTATTYWGLGAWSTTTGYPTCVTLHQQRVVAAGESSNPQMLRGGMTGLYNSMSPFDPDGTVNPDNSYSFQVASGRADGIKWIRAGKQLVFGTTYAEYVANSSGPAIAPTDINVAQQTNYGAPSYSSPTAGALQPVLYDYRLMLPNHSATALFEWSFQFFVEGFRGTRMDYVSNHILLPGITRMEFQYSPVPRLWCLRQDGQLVCATEVASVEAQQSSTQRWGFTRCIMGGAYSGGNAVVLSMCVIPTNGYDQLWLMVKRTINGSTAITVEYLTDPFVPQANTGAATDYANAYFVDCGQQYSGAPTTTFTGLSYLNGATVTALGDGVVYPNLLVSGGSVTLPTAVSKASIGLSYTAKMKTLNLPQQEVQGRLLYVSRIMAFLLNSEGGQVVTGPDTVPLADASSGNNGTLPFTGYTRVPLSQGYKRNQSIAIQQTQPLPLNVLNLQLDYNAGAS